MELRETLIVMRKLLTPEGAWTQGANVRGSRGECIREIAEGVSFCLAGACLYADNYESHSDRVISYLSGRLPRPNRGIVEWNDVHGRTQAEVLAFLDESIAELTPLDGHNHGYVSWDDVTPVLEDA